MGEESHKIECLFNPEDISITNEEPIDNSICDIHLHKSTIMLNFTGLFDAKAKSNKSYQEISVNSPTPELMEDFLTRLNVMLRGLRLSPIKGLKPKQKIAPPEWNEELEWYDMPSFEVNPAMMTITNVMFKIERCDNVRRANFVEEMMRQFDVKITPSTTSIWFPPRPTTLSPHKNLMWVETKEIIKNKYPIYIISKGRWEKRLTQRYLEWSGLDYLIVVEPSEYEEYAKVIPNHKILVAPEDFSKRQQGGIPVRNFVWEHSIKAGAKKHWILDDNIVSYMRCCESERTLVKGGVAFRSIEDFCDRFTNVKMSGHNYTMFAITSNTTLKPIVWNSRCYSSILLSNDLLTDGLLEEGWRGRYNEDTDLSLRILKKGFPTALFNSFAAQKLTTLTCKGGNTDTIYAVEDALLLKAKSLADQHPDVAEITTRFGRTHHYVNYKPFKHLKPIYKDGVKETLTKTTNNYGLELTAIDLTWKAPK